MVYIEAGGNTSLAVEFLDWIAAVKCCQEAG